MKKKLLLIVSILAVAFALAGCTSKDETVEFEYNSDELAQYVTDASKNYMYYASVQEFYDYLEDAGTDSGISQVDIDAIGVFYTMKDEYGEFKEFTGDYEIEESGADVLCTLIADCEDGQVEVRATLESNLAYYNFEIYAYENQGYDEASAKSILASNGIYPYKISEFEVAASQTLSDKMKAAGTNTLIGMGIVFIALIFIAFIISLLKYVPMLLDKDTREARKAEKAKKNAPDEETKEEENIPVAETVVDIVNTATGESVMNDSELVAVITAAIAASSEGRSIVIYPSNDKLVARPIRRIKR